MKFVWPTLKKPVKPPENPVSGHASITTPPHISVEIAGKELEDKELVDKDMAGKDARLVALEQLLKGVVSHIRLNSNSRILLSLRGSPSEGIRLSLHQGLLDHPAALTELPAWIRSHGRTLSPALRTAIDSVFARLAKKDRAYPATIPEFATLNGPADLEALYSEVHAAWFPQLTRPPIFWGPHQRPKRRRHIRFAAYHRRPHARIIVNRLLDQPWVAREFLTFVLYHELCHHAQACDPVRGETPHSARFKSWEARYPRLPDLLVWEKIHLNRFLGMSEER